MLSELVQLSFDKIMQTRAYTVVILGARDKKFAIYTDPSIGRTLQIYLTGTEKPRPLTHDLMVNILKSTHTEIEKIVVSDLKDNSYFAVIYLRMNGKTIEIDARPSDSLALAVRVKCPIFVSEKV